jgi:hypothetical protein
VALAKSKSISLYANYCSTITRSCTGRRCRYHQMQYLSLLPTTTSKSLSLGISFRTVVHVTFARFCLVLPPGVFRLSPRRPWLCKNYQSFQPYWDFLYSEYFQSLSRFTSPSIISKKKLHSLSGALSENSYPPLLHNFTLPTCQYRIASKVIGNLAVLALPTCSSSYSNQSAHKLKQMLGLLIRAYIGRIVLRTTCRPPSLLLPCLSCDPRIIKQLIFAIAVTNVTLDVGCMGTIPVTQIITFLDVLDNKQNTCHDVTFYYTFGPDREFDSFQAAVCGDERLENFLKFSVVGMDILTFLFVLVLCQ